MRERSAAHRLGRALLCAAPLALIALAACADAGAEPVQTLPPGTDPDKVRFFCTQEGDRAAGLVGYPPDYVAKRRRAAEDAFAACMARHNVKP
ncbi:MAG TPA: hypothetical protein VMV26_18070 [Alphaproteobacteria bacterium]|jgi:hypothetical protein|nr:hypothetical protein [Alphaproteobacteria bacterium]